MSKTIWKFDLATVDIQRIIVPEGAELLSVQIQKQTPYIWALVDSTEREEERIIRIFSTGYAIEDSLNLKYIDTYQEMDGDLVWHVFEESK
jgi:hypothetical protein